MTRSLLLSQKVALLDKLYDMIYELPQDREVYRKNKKNIFYIRAYRTTYWPISADNTSQPIYRSGSSVSITEVFKAAGVKIINMLKCFCFVSSCLAVICYFILFYLSLILPLHHVMIK